MVDEGLEDEGQCSRCRVVVLDGEDVFWVDYIKGVDGVDGGGAEKTNGVEEVADYVFLGEPAVFPIVVEGGIGGGLLQEPLPPALTWYWYHKILCSFKDEIYSLH